MTFFMIGGIVCTMSAVLCVFIYLIAHKMDDHSTAAKIIIWVGMLLGVAGASLLTIEYSFPNISHPKPEYVPTVYDHFVSFYGEKYKTFIEEEEHIVVNEYIYVSHSELKERQDLETPDNGYTYAFFKTYVVYESENDYYDISIMNEYVFNADYSYQNIISSKMLNQ